MKYKLKQSTVGQKLSISTICTGNCQIPKHTNRQHSPAQSVRQEIVTPPTVQPTPTAQTRNHDGGKPLELDKSWKNATVFQLAAD